MRAKGWIGAGLIAAAVALLLLASQGDDATADPAAAAPLALDDPARIPREPALPAPADLAGDASAAEPLVPAPPAPSATPPTPAPGESLWTTRVLLPDGRAASGVPWVLESEWLAEGAFSARGAPAPPPVTGVTDATGRLVARLAPLPGCLRELRVEPAEHLPATWSAEERESGAVRELQPLVLVAGGTLTGRVRLAGGGPLPDGVHVSAHLWSDWDPSGPLESRPQLPGRSAPVGADGRFTLARVPPGRLSVRADVPGSVGPRLVEVDLADGATAEVELVSPDIDPAVSRRLLLQPRGAPGRPCAGVLPEHVRLRTLAGEREPAPLALMKEELVFEDLEPGEYLVEVDDPAFLPVQLRARTGPGGNDLRLTGDSTLELRVVEAGTGQPVEEFGLRLQSLRPDQWRATPDGPDFLMSSSSWADALPLGVHAGGVAVVERLAGHLHRLRVEAPGFVPASLSWPGVPRGQRGTLVASLVRAGQVAGVVVDEAGAPQAGVRVGLFEAPPPGEAYFFLDEEEYWSFEPSQGRTCQVLSEGVTDDDGRFVLAGEPGRRCVARAWRSPACDAASGILELGAAAPPGELRLVLPPAHELAGRVQLPAAVPAERLTLFAVPRVAAGVPAAPGVARRRAPLVGRLGPDGGFRFADASPGTWDLWLSCAAERYLDVGGSLPEWTGDYARLVGAADVPLRDALLLIPAAADTPGLLGVHVLVDGAAAGGLDVAATAMDGRGVARGATSAEGLATLGPLWPGSLRIAVSDSERGWVSEAPTPAGVPPGAVGVCRVEVTEAAGELLVLDAVTGQPRGSAILVIYRRTPGGWAWDAARTGADGRLALVRPAGELRVLLAPVGDLLLPREGEEFHDFIRRRAAAGHMPFLAEAAGIPAEPPPQAARVDWRPGVGSVDVSL
jgi:hypothetical protein